MPRFEIDQRSVRLTVRNLQQANRALRRRGAVAVRAGGRELLQATKANVSAPAPSAEVHARNLAAQDHPYATRHGSIRIRPSGGFPGFGRRDLLVHTVTGALLSAIVGEFDRNRASFQVKLDEGKAPHGKFVIQGTRVMLPRDIIRVTATDPRVLDRVREALFRAFGRL